ncbi:MAG TPA: thiamine pyrophosphate-dependent dehydrogenase E1 component subunit alpha [Chloroflexota bacterium]|nr:thiamine pyrophosphate-dependent dehydrogenase E1 component subunit alpha [Chloroflexota bacterium]
MARRLERNSGDTIADALNASMPHLDRLPEPYQVLDAAGLVVGTLPDLADEQLVALYRWMLFGQCLDERALQLQRQGRIGVWGPGRGQEAAQAGLGLAMGPEDWIFPSYREAITLGMRGLDLETILQYVRGLYWLAEPAKSGVFPIQISIGDQSLHAVGAGMAFALQERPAVAVASIGDGATSEGDFHEALNFGGVFRARTVIFVQNNQWAISMPRAAQTAAPTLVQKALAHGIAGYLVDGNDVLAVYEVCRHALAQARAGEGMVLVEALTYRLGAHTTADDPKRYQPPAEIEEWSTRDPLRRMRRFLEDRKLWDEAAETSARTEAYARIDAAVARIEAMPIPSFERVFETTFATPTPRQIEGRARWKEGQ